MVKSTKVGVPGARLGSQSAPPNGLDRDAILTEMVRRLVGAYQPEWIYLFGSRARGDAGPDSDYDLLVVVPESAPLEFRDSRRAYAELTGVGAAKDVVVMTREYYQCIPLRPDSPGRGPPARRQSAGAMSE